MTQDPSRRQVLKALGGTAALASAAGCSSIEDLTGGGAPETTPTPEENGTNTTPDKDRDLQDDLKRLNNFKLGERGFESWEDANRILTVDGARNIEGAVRIQDVTGEGEIQARYLQGAGAVEAFLADSAYRMGELLRVVMDGELENNSFNSLALSAIDQEGFGYGIRMNEELTKNFYNQIEGLGDQGLDSEMQSMLIQPEKGKTNRYHAPEDKTPGIYLEQGQRRNLSFGDETYIVQALDIRNEGAEILVKTGDEEVTPFIEFDTLERVENRRLRAVDDPVGDYGDGIAVESLLLDCDKLQENIYTGDTRNLTHRDHDYAIEVEEILDGERVNITNHDPGGNEIIKELGQGDRYEFDMNMSYTFDQVLQTNGSEGVAVISVEQC